MSPANGATLNPRAFSQHVDGIQGTGLGCFGPFQYALALDGEVYRRKASEAGTYGGWRWECSFAHAQRYATLYPFLEVIAKAEGVAS